MEKRKDRVFVFLALDREAGLLLRSPQGWKEDRSLWLHKGSDTVPGGCEARDRGQEASGKTELLELPREAREGAVQG